MEHLENLETNTFEDSRIQDYLLEAAKWAKFLSILGFIGVGFMVIFSLFMGIGMGSLASLSTLGGGLFISFIYLIIAALYFFPLLYLFKFATNVKRGILNHDNETLVESFKNLKSTFKFLGIYSIVVLSLYLLIFLFMLTTLGAGFLSGM